MFVPGAALGALVALLQHGADEGFGEVQIRSSPFARFLHPRVLWMDSVGRRLLGTRVGDELGWLYGGLLGGALLSLGWPASHRVEPFGLGFFTGYCMMALLIVGLTHVLVEPE